MELKFELDEHAAHVDGDSVGSLDEAVLEALLAKTGRIKAKIDSLEAQARSTRYIQEYILTKYLHKWRQEFWRTCRNWI